MAEKKEMISVENFARRVGISRSLAYQLVNKGPSEGGVEAYRFGQKRVIRVPAAEVQRFTASRVLVEA